MAIPISMPTSDSSDENYRALDLLLEQLLVTLRQVLVHRRRETATTQPDIRVRRGRTHHDVTTLETTEFTEIESRLPLPDLVLDAEAECRVRKDVTTTTTSPDTRRRTTDTTRHSWVQVGADLRTIADQFRSTNTCQQDEESKCSRIKEASVLSLFCPPLGGSVWTTVALLVGWGLLSRTR